MYFYLSDDEKCSTERRYELSIKRWSVECSCGLLDAVGAIIDKIREFIGAGIVAADSN